MNLHEGKYLTFSLGKEDYGIPILKVKEIIGMMDVTPIPRTPEFVKGVINLRGKIIPIMDLRLKFSLEERPYNERTCIIVVEVSGSEAQKQIGVIVDAVSEVLNIGKGDIEPPPSYEGEENGFLTGIGKVKNRVVMLLNTEKVFSLSKLSIPASLVKGIQGSDENV